MKIVDVRSMAYSRTAHRLCAPNPAISLVEALVHIDSGDLPDPLQYPEVEAPDDIAAENVDVEALGRWRTNQKATHRAGDEWLRSGRTALLRAPSVIVPATWNVLINPHHPESAQVRLVRVHGPRP